MYWTWGLGTISLRIRMKPAYRIGIDVGGTNTDAVILAGSDIVEWTKVVTTKDVSGGISAALEGQAERL
jgi:N-methylhydantoinase A/oxoprolinase/acetone carboxylase beta subunit